MDTILMDRIKIEQSIIGSCLLENGYLQVADVLTHKNFTRLVDGTCGMDHQVIFQVFEKFFPTRPIDIVTVSHHLRHSPGYTTYIAELSSRVSSSANLRYYALLLLEYNLRTSFVELLQKEMRSGQLNTATMAAIQEIIGEGLDPDKDIFDVIEMTNIHLTNNHIEDYVIESLLLFSSKIDKRIANIRQLASIDCLIINLENLSGLSSNITTKMAISHLTDLLKAIISTGKIHTNLAHKIFELKFD